MLDQIAERESNPGDHHRPAFDATHAIDAIFKRRQLHEVVDIVSLLFCNIAADFYFPRTRAEVARQLRWAVFVGAEFVEVVVIGDVLKRGLLLSGVVLAFNSGEFRIGMHHRRGSHHIAARRQSCAEQRCACQKLAAIHVGGFPRDFR